MKTFLIFAFIATYASAEKLLAKVTLTPDPKFGDKNVNGVINFSQDDEKSPVLITGEIKGLNPKSDHGFHVHAKGDISGGCTAAGPHFNPANVTHGAPNETVRHVGDLGNVNADEQGVAKLNITDHLISLTGKNSIIGRAVVVHSQADDLGKGGTLVSKETGNAGDRWACGIIGTL